jgi:two-component system cell cycle sensor histidine kinase/response regulator CckA
MCESDHGNEIDVLLTDVVMPGMSGADLAGRFRAQRPNARVVFMSGYTDDVLAHFGMDQPQIALLSKPFRLQDLVSKLREMLTNTEDMHA